MLSILISSYVKTTDLPRLHIHKELPVFLPIPNPQFFIISTFLFYPFSAD